MPTIDMPLAELLRYRGTGEKPDDFDAYWERALAELDAVAPNPEFVPADIPSNTAECFDLYFTGVRGARIHAKFLKPKNIRDKAPALLMFHGYTGSSGDWSDKLAYAAEGYVVAALDCRGQGGLSEDTGGVKGNTHNGHIIRGMDNEDSQDLLMRHIFLDTAQLARIVADLPDVDARRIYATGGSQGGGLTLACAALEPRVSLIATVFPFLTDYRRVWDLDLDQNAYAEMRQYLRMFDPLHEQVDRFFRKLSYIDVHYLAPRIRAKTLFVATLMDNICPPSTQFAAYNAIEAEKSVLIYPNHGHEGLPHANDFVFRFFQTGELPPSNLDSLL